jgi:uncharacterized protein YcbK (DUF882 family)
MTGRSSQCFSTLAAAAVLLSGVAIAQTPLKHPPPAPVYAKSVQRWHTPPGDAAPEVDDHGRPLLVLYSLNTTTRVTLAAAGALGGFGASDLDRAAFALRESATGNEHPVEPRLLDLVYRVMTHFGAQEIRVISGYRTPSRGGASNHGKGRALDFIVPGTRDIDVATFARELGFVGVGIYPTSGFVHLDVRDRSYFWSDASGPGRRNRERGILGDLARSSDHDATSRGEQPAPACLLQLDVDAALRSCVRAAPGRDEDDDAND